MGNNFELINRELSWLAFNDRVLQEAADKSVPVIERVKFLGIFSNNLDEFFKVRVATLNRIVNFGVEARNYLEMDPEECLEIIQSTVIKLQSKFEKIYEGLLDELREDNIIMLNEKQLTPDQLLFVRKYFTEKVRPNIVPIMLDKRKRFPTVKDKMIYLAIKMHRENKAPDYALVELPTDVLPRFLVLPPQGGRRYVMMLDDVIRASLPDIFNIFDYEDFEAYTIKLTRDAELDIEEDVSKSFMDKLESSIENRKKGQFVRFVYDATIPDDLFDFLLKKLKLRQTQNLIPGGRYHNFKDFMGFPNLGLKDFVNPPMPPLKHRHLDKYKSMFKAISEKDSLLTYPFQSFNYVIDLLREAAIDPKVTAIRINLYRVAKNSKIINALISAAKNHKKVEVVLELQARFDEKNNLYWSSKLQEEGVKVLFGVNGLKVHSKLILIERKEDKKVKYYAHIGTGNFHEGNAKLYTDYSLLTADQRIATEVNRVFNFLRENYKIGPFEHLLVSPFSTRSKMVELIHNEIEQVKQGKEGYIYLKLNNLQDRDMIIELYKASQAGVKIVGVVRGICSLIPGVPGMSENITIVSVIDRFLEHTRLMIFGNGGDEQFYLGSADWMTRNLDRRVEVTAPVYDPIIKKVLKETFMIYVKDNVKARIIDKNQYNLYVSNQGESRVRAQYEVYDYFKNRLGEEVPDKEFAEI
ncbi:polyphosphate kinase 1 [Luteibaculum oceani]|uniref:Polyphosphate kinase n=1 Tax=Luteibaculum oceani TaxID=1294296 RepID=A0A5C6V931_9FLAO|nr:polyphosphate kinase 1 [Luteibaculum oceani]TXC81607.1 polyphosphate kinase 1 [Luteibaculum oceani]